MMILHGKGQKERHWLHVQSLKAQCAIMDKEYKKGMVLKP